MGKTIRKENMRKGRVGRRLISVLLAFNLFITAFSGIVFFHYQPAKAADGDPDPTTVWLETDYGTGTSHPITGMVDMETKTMNLYLRTNGTVYTDESKFKVVWSIGNEEQKKIASVAPSADQQTMGVITALKAGQASIQVYVYEVKDGAQGQQLQSATMTVYVHFGIYTNDVTKIKTINNKNALILYTGDSYQLELNIGKAEDATWESDNIGVANFVSTTKGKITATGAGRTLIYARGSTEQESAQLYVYVIPKVSTTGASGSYTNSLVHTMESGGYLYVDVNFEGTIQSFDQKVYWNITDIDGKELANSTSPNGDAIQITYPKGIYDKEMQITGLAGQYFMHFYTAGSVSSFTEEYTPYNTTEVALTISSGIDHKDEIIGIGDMYNLAESYNLSLDDFKALFSVTCFQDNGETSPEAYNVPATNYATINTNDMTITALREGKVVALMKVLDKNKVQALKGTTDPIPDYYITHFTIADKITLSSESLTMMVGQEHTFHVSVQSQSTGPIHWTSSEPNTVSIDGQGINAVAKALRETTSDVLITAEMDTGGGHHPRATCYVKVEKAMTDFKLIPSGVKQINVGDSFLLKADIPNGNQLSEVPLMYQASEDGIVSIDVEPSKKQATITALKGGRTTIMVTNTLNMTVQRMTVEVLVPITSIEFLQDTYKLPFYQTGKNLMYEIKYEPGDATSKELVWTVSNSSVATIDESGYMRYKAPGTITVACKPQYNPNAVMAQATFTITGGPDEIIFENLKDDHLEIEAGDKKTVNLKFIPDTAETKLVWKTDRAGVVHLDYDETRKQLEVVGQKPGTCTVTCRTEDNVYYSFTVTCKEAAQGISFASDTITLYNGDPIRGKYQLVPILKPTTSTDTVTYTVRDEKIATVDAKGLVTAVSAGKTYISATTSSGKTAVVDVIVIDMVSKLQGDFKRATVYIGETLTITPKVIPDTATNKTVKWSWEPFDTDDPGSVILKENGTSVDVTGVSQGMVVLTGISDDNSSAYVEYTLTVKYRNPVYSTKVTLSPKTKYVNVGKAFKVSRSVKNAYKGNKTLRWKSSNSKVASVSSSGKVKAKKVGKATITATCLDGSKAKGKMKVVVRRLVTKIKMNKSSANILVGKSVKLSVRITPSNATIKGVTWKSGDKSIATVDGGKVIGVAPGMVKITATSKDVKKKKTYCWVTVSEPVPVTNFTVADANLTVAKGSSIQSGVVPNPTNATDSIKYWSDTPSVASVTSKGKIKAKKPGKATIYARAANGVEAHVDVTVVDINRKAVTLRQYATEKLSIYNITTGITWYSARPDIASVDANGTVKAKLPGTTVIYAYVDGVKLGCKVTVKRIR